MIGSEQKYYKTIMRDAIRNNTGSIEGMNIGQYIWPYYICIKNMMVL